MQRVLSLLILLALLLMACGGNRESVTRPPATPPATVAPDRVEQPQGTPQLIEFYADW